MVLYFTSKNVLIALLYNFVFSHLIVVTYLDLQTLIFGGKTFTFHKLWKIRI